MSGHETKVVSSRTVRIVGRENKVKVNKSRSNDTIDQIRYTPTLEYLRKQNLLLSLRVKIIFPLNIRMRKIQIALTSRCSSGTGISPQNVTLLHPSAQNGIGSSSL